jgi:hypothetical protein
MLAVSRLQAPNHVNDCQKECANGKIVAAKGAEIPGSLNWLHTLGRNVPGGRPMLATQGVRLVRDRNACTVTTAGLVFWT